MSTTQQKYFEWMFITNQASPEQLVELLDDCARKRDHVNAPVWQQYILNRVLMYAEKLTEQSIVETNKIPYGIFFGTKIYDTVKEQAGCVVGRGRSGEYVLIAFEGDVEPQIIAVGPEGFEKGYFKIV